MKGRVLRGRKKIHATRTTVRCNRGRRLKWCRSEHNNRTPFQNNRVMFGSVLTFIFFYLSFFFEFAFRQSSLQRRSPHMTEPCALEESNVQEMNFHLVHVWKWKQKRMDSSFFFLFFVRVQGSGSLLLQKNNGIRRPNESRDKL